jgi:hypothetical protein
MMKKIYIENDVVFVYYLDFCIFTGIYVESGNESAPEEFRGMGIRIEDDVLITESGSMVLSSQCPKSVCELEDLMASSTHKFH